MKTKITTCIVVALMLFSGMSQAQKRNRADRMQKACIQLTDQQKQELRSARIEFAKATLDVKNELNELRAYQRTLMSADNLDERKIFGNIDKMTALEKQLMEERINRRLATNGLWCDEQCNFNNQRGDCPIMMKNQNMKPGRDRMHRGKRADQMFRKGKGCTNGLGLSEKQEEQMQELRMAHQNAIQNLREEMQELRLKQKHLLNDEKPNKNEILGNLDRISSIQNQLAKERVKNQKEIRNILDKDQLVLFLSRPHRMQKNGKVRMSKCF